MTRESTPEKLVIGMDVGSTTVKAVVMDPNSKEILWSDYQRHLTKQPEKVLELLTAIQAAFPQRPFENEGTWRMFLTGSCKRSTPSAWRSSICIPTCSA
jgi:activator of 2-hydroxyglutaryl-CoA dehydratase